MAGIDPTAGEIIDVWGWNNTDAIGYDDEIMIGIFFVDAGSIEESVLVENGGINPTV